MKVIIRFKDRVEELFFVESIEFYNKHLCILQKTKEFNRETNYKPDSWISFEVFNEVDD